MPLKTNKKKQPNRVKIQTILNECLLRAKNKQKQNIITVRDVKVDTEINSVFVKRYSLVSKGFHFLPLPEVLFSAIRNPTGNLQEPIHGTWSEARFYVRKPSSE